MDGSDATSVQRGLTALTKPPLESGAIRSAASRLTPRATGSEIWPRRSSRHRSEFATLNIVKKLYLVAGLAALLSTLAAPAHAQKKADIAFDFGPSGVWLQYADAGSRQLHPLNPEEMASGDVDGNGQSDLILDFPGQGVWIWLNDSQWLQLHTLNAAQIITADLDGNGRSAVLLDFPGLGIWVWRHNVGWSQLHALSARTSWRLATWMAMGARKW